MAVSSFTLFLFGLAVGSFLNVLSIRYQADQRIFDLKTIGGRSRCPHCGKDLVWYELVPLLSFFIQRGCCRSCGERISWQYPIVELATGLIFALIPFSVFQTFQVAFHRIDGSLPLWYFFLSGIFLLAGAALILISAIDFRLKIIPDQSNLLIAVLGLLAIVVKNYYGLFGEQNGSFLGFYAALFGLRENIWLNHLAGAAFGLVFFGLIVFLSRGRGMGMGDVKLAGALGLLLGWPDVVLTLMLAFIVGAVCSIILMLAGKKGMKSMLPFGPFIAIGAFLVIFWGKAIMSGYFSLFP